MTSTTPPQPRARRVPTPLAQAKAPWQGVRRASGLNRPSLGRPPGQRLCAWLGPARRAAAPAHGPLFRRRVREPPQNAGNLALTVHWRVRGPSRLGVCGSTGSMPLRVLDRYNMLSKKTGEFEPGQYFEGDWRCEGGLPPRLPAARTARDGGSSGPIRFQAAVSRAKVPN